jgi:hypothetical protein
LFIFVLCICSVIRLVYLRSVYLFCYSTCLSSLCDRTVSVKCVVSSTLSVFNFWQNIDATSGSRAMVSFSFCIPAFKRSNEYHQLKHFFFINHLRKIGVFSQNIEVYWWPLHITVKMLTIVLVKIHSKLLIYILTSFMGRFQ